MAPASFNNLGNFGNNVGGNVGATVGKYGGGLVGNTLAGPIGGWIGSRLGNLFGRGVGAGVENLGALGMRGIGLLLNRFGGGPSATISPGGIPYGRVPAGGAGGGGVTASAGGWSIDANGNLVDRPSAQYANQTSFPHDSSIPAFARGNMAAIARRNII